MKKIACLNLLFLLFQLTAFCQPWTNEQLAKANTASDIDYLSETEKEAIQYINLARLFPAQFVVNEVQDYPGAAQYGNNLENSSYKRSLIKQLRTKKAAAPLYFDKAMYESAKCFAGEMGKRGTVGHKRKKCTPSYTAECCSYGMDTGKDIAMQWLIDEGVAGLGHRINCLNTAYSKIGLSIHPHKKYGICAVADME